MRRLVALALVAASTALAAPAHAVVDCQEQQPCMCGQEIAVGLPGKDPIVRLGRIDC